MSSLMSYVFDRVKAGVSSRHYYRPSFWISLKVKKELYLFCTSISPWIKHMKVQVINFVCFSSSFGNTATVFWLLGKSNTTRLVWSLILEFTCILSVLHRKLFHFHLEELQRILFQRFPRLQQNISAVVNYV